MSWISTSRNFAQWLCRVRTSTATWWTGSSSKAGLFASGPLACFFFLLCCWYIVFFHLLAMKSHGHGLFGGRKDWHSWDVFFSVLPCLYLFFKPCFLPKPMLLSEMGQALRPRERHSGISSGCPEGGGALKLGPTVLTSSLIGLCSSRQEWQVLEFFRFEHGGCYCRKEGPFRKPQFGAFLKLPSHLRSRLGEGSLRLDERSRWQGLLHPGRLWSGGQVLGGTGRGVAASRACQMALVWLIRVSCSVILNHVGEDHGEEEIGKCVRHGCSHRLSQASSWQQLNLAFFVRSWSCVFQLRWRPLASCCHMANWIKIINPPNGGFPY